MAISDAIDSYFRIVKEHRLDELCCMVLPTKNDCCTTPCTNYQIVKRKIKRSMINSHNSPFLNKLNELADNVDSLIQYLNNVADSSHKNHQHIVAEYIETIHCQIYELNNLHKEKHNHAIR